MATPMAIAPTRVKGNSSASAEFSANFRAFFSPGVRSAPLGFSSVGIKSLLEEEFSGAAGGLDHGLNKGNPKLAFFKLQNTVNGTAGGRGDRVFEQRRMVAGFEHHAGSALHGLCGEKRRDVAGETDLHTGFGQRFENDVGKGGSAGGQACDRVHVLFVDDDRAADRLEHGP